MEDKIVNLLLDCRTCLVWLRVIEKAEYKYNITKVIDRLDDLIKQIELDSIEDLD